MDKISAGTIGRLIALLVSFTAIGANMDTDNMTEVITLAVTVGIALLGYWKDNDITKKARERKIKLKELDNQSPKDGGNDNGINNK